MLPIDIQSTQTERSTYQATLRSEILRTGAVTGNVVSAASGLSGAPSSSTVLPGNGNGVGGGSSGDELSNAIAPLDALKEISRKRIHCDVSNLL